MAKPMDRAKSLPNLPTGTTFAIITISSRHNAFNRSLLGGSLRLR